MPADPTPAAELRAAAARLRERAGAATEGCWHHLCMGSDGCSVINDGHLRDRKPVAWFGRKEWKADHADALYVAMMAPPVALAFAGLLEDAAGQYDDLDESPYPGAAAFVAGDFGGDPDPALVAARAVLAGDRP